MNDIASRGYVSGANSSSLQTAWRWFAGLGVALILLGLCASANLFLATVATIYYVGALMLFGGVLQIFHAAAARNWGVWLFGGILYLLAGLAVFNDPLFAAAFLTLLLAVSLGLSGMARLWFGLRVDLAGRGWLIASGVASIAAAVLIGLGWPVNAIWILGFVLAIDLLFQGVALLGTGLAMRTALRG
ncbi:HdeD family acid-resistance protein [Sphingomonas sp. RT2P30]|uniref:HdeD family acid-resistance protein n=1 Tax=Parasphingomonas halimpatiens TaxID=3096162 RepID=UPI002FC7B3E8